MTTDHYPEVQAALKDRLFRGGAWALAGRLGTSTSMLLVTAILARLLNVAELGAFFLAMSLAQGIGVAGRMGLDQAGLQLVASLLGSGRAAQARVVIRRVLWAGAACGTAVLWVLLAGGAPAALTFFDSDLLAAAAVPFAAYAGVLTVRGIVAEIFRAFDDIRSASLFDGLLTATVSVVVFSLLAGTVGSASLAQVITLYFVAAAISAAIGLLVLARRAGSMPRANAGPAPRLWPVAGPLWVAGVMRLIQTGADVWILAAFAPETDVALYVASFQIVALVGVPLVIANAVLPSTIADLWERGEAKRLQSVLRRTASLAAAPAFVALPVLALFGGSVLAFVYGADYRGGGVLLAILTAGYLVQLATGSSGRTLAMTGHQDVLMKITAGTGILTVAGLLLVTSAYGVVGAAIVASASRAGQNLAIWIACGRTTGLWTHVNLVHLVEIGRTRLVRLRERGSVSRASGAA